MVSQSSFRSEAAEEKHHQEWIENERIYYSGEEDDPIAPRLLKIISDIENRCRPIIEKSEAS
jgi:hypothetical protein